MNGPLNLLAINALAIAIAEEYDSESLDLLSAYFYLLGSALRSLSITKTG